MRTVPVQKNLRLATMGNEHSCEDGEAGSRPSDGETDAMSGADDGYLSRGDTDGSDLSGEEQRRRKGLSSTRNSSTLRFAVAPPRLQQRCGSRRTRWTRSVYVCGRGPGVAELTELHPTTHPFIVDPGRDPELRRVCIYWR